MPTFFQIHQETQVHEHDCNGMKAAVLLIGFLVGFAGCIVTPQAEPEPINANPEPATPEPAAESAAEPEAGPAPSPEPEPEPEEEQSTQVDDGNSTTEGDAISENKTVYLEPVVDKLLEQVYVIAAGVRVPISQYEFTVESEYDTLELIGRYDSPTYIYAAWLQVTVTSPSGQTVMSYNGVDSMAVVTGTGGSTSAFPIGYHFDPEPGVYTISISGAGAPRVELTATGYKGGAPNFNFKNIDTGNVETLRDYVGSVVIVDLMATWCGPCAKAMPGLKQIYEDYDGKVQILSIDVDSAETNAELQSFKNEHKANWTFGFEETRSASNSYGSGWIPTFAIVDQHGGLLYRHIGAMNHDEVRKIIDYSLENR